MLDTSIQFTPGRREGSIRFRAFEDEIKQRNESVTITLTITDNGGIDVIVGQMGSTSVNIIDINGELSLGTGCTVDCIVHLIYRRSGYF